ncbi:hypothetical protein KVQ01_11390 [Escherichia coli]|uniref:hypothetical protein n=1 Tax=Escherichia coli TaxID=562 RepID=UPI001F05C148|nr:hypothetical protein [Escherichia coli]MCH0685623.1 hypothetical protein [Escherichia coli]MDZ8664475.1 hypothetical protein [Escherichia coli]WRX87705.1 hypothetical protein SM938_22525 [Escherichia coli]
MTLVITILADDNARNRRRARRASQREQAMQDDSLARQIAQKLSGCVKADRATSLGSLRDYQEPEATEQKRNRVWYSKPGEYGITCAGRQKTKGKSIPLI